MISTNFQQDGDEDLIFAPQRELSASRVSFAFDRSMPPKRKDSNCSITAFTNNYTTANVYAPSMSFDGAIINSNQS
jgi:hypothetical protein